MLLGVSKYLIHIIHVFNDNNMCIYNLGTLSAKAGPAASCVGCLGFAGFSLVIDKIVGH